MVLQREAEAGDLLPEVGRHVIDVAAVDAGHDVQPPGDRIPADHRRGLGEPDVGDVAEP